MRDFKSRGNSGFGARGGSRGGGFGKKSFGGDRGPITMHKTVCDQCKKPCEVPFRPTEGKPVYCNNCFGGKREGSASDYRTPARTDFGADIKKVSGEEIKKQIEVLNVKIDRLTQVIEDMVSSSKE
jgi:CxxC-x17-CxxC domain-containing protein